MSADVEAIAERVFVALADPTRRSILAALASKGPATATDLAALLPVTRQAISKHLVLLTEAGLVVLEPGERRRVRYRLRSAPMQVAQQFLAALARDWDGPLHALMDHLDALQHEGSTLMSTSYKTSFTVDATPQDVFDAVTNVRGWWADDIQGGTSAEGDEFVQRYKDMHRCRIRITEAIPGKKITWHVLENYFSFTADQTEWTGTTITFDIKKKGSKTELAFTHDGLVPAYECYDVCSNAWAFHVGDSLKDLITTGKGDPTRG